MIGLWKNFFPAIIVAGRNVFSFYKFLVLALLIGFVVFAASMWIRNIDLLSYAIRSSVFSVVDKVLLFVLLLGGIGTSVSLLSAVLYVFVSVLFGINSAFFVYYVSKRRNLPSKKEGFGTAGGILSGILGIGCASCGSFLLSSILAFFGAAGLIAFLPLKGLEFSVISAVLLLTSIYWIAKAINSRQSCEIVR